MANELRIAVAQTNFLVGAIEENTAKIIQLTQQARDELKAHLVLFSELAITGYPPEDLLFRAELHARCQAALLAIAQETKGIDIVVGYPEYSSGKIYNSAAIYQNGVLNQSYRKQFLPNYNLFDEKRYFTAMKKTTVFSCQNRKIGVLICEDSWYKTPALAAKKAGAELLVVINASPFSVDKAQARSAMIAQRTQETKLPIIYVNTVGGQDEAVFDGGSLAANADGAVVYCAPYFTEQLQRIVFTAGIIATSYPPIPPLSTEERIYQALLLGIRDYVQKNKFPSVLIGLSGGIDSALTLCLAVDALGAERVSGLLMPSRYTATMSIEDAEEQAKILRVKSELISIEPLVTAFQQALASCFNGYKQDSTEENLQARIRGNLLMAISNKKGALVLTTGNKSEMAVGYATLYGDMAGGFCALKNVPKTMVYRLAHYRNQQSLAIPQRILERPPSAELAAGQLDQDTLPSYDILDAIIDLYIEQEQSAEAIIAQGFAAETVTNTIRLINSNEYKRRQAAPGVRITEHAFGKDRRYPITSRF